MTPPNRQNVPIRLPLAAALLLALSASPHAATITVNQNTDTHVLSQCSLREAIQSANDHAAPPGTNCVVGSGADDTVLIPFDEISLTQGSLTTTGALRIEGTSVGGRTKIARPPDAAPFSIFVVPSGDLTLQRLQISGGRVDHPGYGGGGGIESGASLTLVDSTVSGNSAESDTGWGGGIATKYATSVIDSTISGNAAVDGGGGIAVFGLRSAELTISNSTVANNTVSGGIGGGILVHITVSASLSNSTVVFNKTSSNGSGAGIFVNGGNYGIGQLALNSTLVAANTSGKYAQDLASAVAVSVAGNHDLVRVWDAPIALPADTLTCNPDVAALADNGGPTQTVRLQVRSCAIDVGARNNLQYDQRGEGYARVVGANADIGAFEYSDVIFADAFEQPGA